MTVRRARRIDTCENQTLMRSKHGHDTLLSRTGAESALAVASAGEKRTGTLFLVALPIGNLEDISLRAANTLQRVSVIAAENPQITRRLLIACALSTQAEIVSYRPRTNRNVTASLLGRLCAGEDTALVCDAGTPGIADPGYDLTHAALAAGCRVVAVPGPTAALTALIASGQPTGRFAFDGFPPRARTDRHRFFESLKTETRTLLLYESPARLRSTLAELTHVLGENRSIVILRNVTKPDEWVFRGSLSEAREALRVVPRGEYTLVLRGLES